MVDTAVGGHQGNPVRPPELKVKVTTTTADTKDAGRRLVTCSGSAAVQAVGRRDAGVYGG